MLHPAFWETQFLRTLRSFSRLGLFYFKLGPLPRPTLTVAPAAPEYRLQCRPGLSDLPRSAPQAPAAGPRRGQGAGRLRSLPRRRAGARSWDPSRARQRAHLEAGGRSGERRSSWVRVRVAGKPGPRPSAAPTCGPGRAEAERAAGETAGCNRTVWAIESAAPTLPRKCARGPAPPGPRPRPPLPAGCGTRPRPLVPEAGGRPRPHLPFRLGPQSLSSGPA